VPILLNRLYTTRAQARSAKCGVLQFMFCRHCGFAWNAAFDTELIVYDASYENDQAYSPAFLAHLRARADDVVVAAPAGERLRFLEIGCGQGRFINEVARRAGPALHSAEGFDAAWRGPGNYGPASSVIHKAYFTAATAHLLNAEPNVVVSRHTIEHIPDPVAFLTTVRTALGAASRARIFIETPCVNWILQNEAMQDFFYEHCSLFTPTALLCALRRSGFDDVHVEKVFGGQYLWASATAGNADMDIGPSGQGLHDIAGVRERYVRHWDAVIAHAQANGLVAIWGAGAKGVTFSMMVDPEGSRFDHVIDISPAKQGQYLPVTGLPVVSTQVAAARSPDTIIVMNPNYLTEIEELARAAGITARLIPLNKSQMLIRSPSPARPSVFGPGSTLPIGGLA
jgi:hypothetical protein